MLSMQVEQALTPENVFLLDSKTVNDNGVKAFDIDRFLMRVKQYQGVSVDELAGRIATQFVERGNAQNQRETAESLKRQTGIDLADYLHKQGRIAEKVEQMTQANVALIRSVHSQYFDKIQTAVTQSLLKGESQADLVAELRKIAEMTENRAKLIARDQTSKLNASLTQARHEELGITHYRWSTSGDERVRDTHIENDGKIFAYDAPPDETGHPGHDINCRCVAIPVLDKGEIERAEQEKQEDNLLSIPIQVDPSDKIVLPEIESARFGKLEFVATQLRDKVKHYREGFNPTETKSNPAIWRTYQKEIIRQLEHKDTIAFGHYRDVKGAKVFYNRKTGWVIVFVNGVYLTSMKMDRHSKQWKNYLKNGRLV